MEELGLEKSQFLIDISPLSSKDSKLAFGNRGADRVEFLISTNPGQPPKPLAKIASGGELSRVMLAIKSTLNQDISWGSMIFDEVDTGISGRVADRVGIKLQNLGKYRQVICISHSPQIAARGESHLKVEKVIRKGSSHTIITPLVFEERIEEISRFISGNQLTETSRSAAEEMLRNAE
ncbi:MAG: hypothetical protein GY786_05075 [Proteobacteria bacterium]|nr:hypothetical protein [Pseudomonadota bacterium]